MFHTFKAALSCGMHRSGVNVETAGHTRDGHSSFRAVITTPPNVFHTFKAALSCGMHRSGVNVETAGHTRDGHRSFRAVITKKGSP